VGHCDQVLAHSGNAGTEFWELRSNRPTAREVDMSQGVAGPSSAGGREVVNWDDQVVPALRRRESLPPVPSLFSGVVVNQTVFKSPTSLHLNSADDTRS
jgi:hypothetical protein